jgi:hemolysin III
VRTEEVIPRLRGVLHAHAAWVAVLLAGLLVALAPTPSARVAALVYGGCMIALFGVSGLYHRWRWDPQWRPLLRRVDHAMIWLFIAATYTPIGLLVLDGPLRVVVLCFAWAGAAAGILMTITWPTAPRALAASCYAALGWVGVVCVPAIIRNAGVLPLVLLTIGGLFYTAGAIVFALRRPDPHPHVFGFHEVFHVLIVLAVGIQFAAFAGWVVPGATA